MFLSLLAVATLAFIAGDSNPVSRVGVLVALVALVLLGFHRTRTVSAEDGAALRERIFGGLPVFEFTDAELFDVKATYKRYPKSRRNPRIVAMLAQLLPLRAYNDKEFAILLTRIEYLLWSSRKDRATLQELAILKDKAMQTLSLFEMAVPADLLRKLRFQARCRALDAVLFTEALGHLARTQDVYPLASPAPGLGQVVA